MAETYRSVEVPGFGDVEFPASMTDDQVAEAIRRNVLKQDTLPERPSPLQPEGPAFSTEVPGLAQGEIKRPAAPPPQRHGLIAAGAQKLGFPEAAGAIERADQALPGVARRAAQAVPQPESSLAAALPLLTSPSTAALSLPGAAVGALTTPGSPVQGALAGAAGAQRGLIEDALPPFLSAENLLLMAVSRGTGMAAKYATEAKILTGGVKEAMAAAARIGEVGETAKYGKMLQGLERQFGRQALLAQLGKTVESAFAVGLGTKGATEGWEAAKRGDWQGAAQAFLNVAVAGSIGASARGTTIPKAGKIDVEPFLKEAQHESIARPVREDLSLEALTEKRVQDAWARQGGLNDLKPGEPVPGPPLEAQVQTAWQSRADMLGRGVQPRPEAPEAPGSTEALQIAQEAEQARRILGLVERGQLVLPPEAIAALQADAARGIQPPAGAAPPLSATATPPAAPQIVRPGEPVPSGLPVVEGPAVPMGEVVGPTPGFTPAEPPLPLEPPLIRGVQAPRLGPPEPRTGLGAPLPTSEVAPVPQRAVAGPGEGGTGLGEAPPPRGEPALEFDPTWREWKFKRRLAMASDFGATAADLRELRAEVARSNAPEGEPLNAQPFFGSDHPQLTKQEILQKLDREIARRSPASLGEAPPGVSPEARPAPGPTTVKRAADFKETGVHEVTVGGETHGIFRDPENGWWYLEGESPLIKEQHYSRRVMGFNKTEAVARVEKLVAERGARPGGGLGTAPPGLSPEAPAAPGLGEPPPTPLDAAAEAAAARLKASAGLRGEGPTEAHAGLSAQNLKDMATVAAAKIAKAQRPMTRESFESRLRQEYGVKLPKETLDRVWEVSQDAAALGKAAGPRVARAYVEEHAGPPNPQRVQRALGLEDKEGQRAARINNHLREAVKHVENATIGFQLKGGQIQRMRDNLEKIVAQGHMGREEQAALAREGTAPRQQTEKLTISEESFAKTVKALEVAEGNAQQVLQELRTSGIPIEESPSGLRVGRGFKGDPELKGAIDAVLQNLFDASGDLGRAAKAVAVTKSTWARIGHRQQEALRLSRGLQAELERVPGAMERLKTAGLELRGIQQHAFRRPFLSEMREILQRGFAGGAEDITAFGDDFRRMWRLQFSLRSWIMDVTSDAASIARGVPEALTHDAYLALRGQDMTAPRLRSFLDGIRLRAGKEAFRPVAGGVEGQLGMTAYGEPIRPGTPPPEGASWLQRQWHAIHREGASGEATYRTGSTPLSKAVSVLMDEFSVRGLYLKGAADTATKRFYAQSYVLERAAREGQAKGLTGADLETFVESYRKAPPEQVVKEAARRGNDAGFNQELSSFERRWFRDNPIIQYWFDAFPGWALQHTRWLRDTAGFNIYKAYKNPAEAGVFREADIAGAIGQALAGWGALSYVVKTVLPFVDPETGEVVDPKTRNRMPLRGIEPLATLITLGYLGLGDWKAAGTMAPYSSLPGGGSLATPGGGIIGGPWNEARELLTDPSRLPDNFLRRLVDVVNRMIPGRPALEVMKAFTDPISRRGLGSPIPGYSKTLPAVIDPATGKPRQPRYEIPIMSEIMERVGLSRDLPALFGTQTPGAQRVVEPVEKLLERFDVPSAQAKRAPGIYRNVPDLPGDLSARDLSQAQRDKWREFFGQERQRILGPLAKDFDRLDARARQDPDFHKAIRREIEALDAAAARSAVDLLMRSDPTLRPTAEKREAPFTGPYADRPGGLGSPVP